MSRDLELNHLLLYGIAVPPLVQCLGAQVQPALAESLQAMAEAASAAGFELAIASGYRDFERQKHIFNAKAQGVRPVLDGEGRVVDVTSLSDDALLHAILRWSALPGMSRHHWGTDVDVYDRHICVGDYQLQLTLDECAGPMAEFHRWLDKYLAAQSDFIRPYAQDLGGVAPEPWHLSYAPLSAAYAQAYSPSQLQAVLESSDIALKPIVLAQLADLYQRYAV